MLLLVLPDSPLSSPGDLPFSIELIPLHWDPLPCAQHQPSSPSSPLTGAPLALAVYAVPTAAMLLTSVLLSKYSIRPITEACLQNVAAGFVLAAVAQELFPLIDVPSNGDAFLGISVGFLLGMAVVYGMEPLVDRLSELSADGEGADEREEEGGSSSDSRDAEDGEGGVDEVPAEPEEKWDAVSLIEAGRAISQPEHKQHLEDHLVELVEAIGDMQVKCEALMGSSIDPQEAERYSEEVDETSHRVNYILDHCRRLLEGSQTGQSQTPFLTRLSPSQKDDLRNGLRRLKATAEHLCEHVRDATLGRDIRVLAEMHAHMTHLERHLHSFHDAVSQAGSRWIRKFPLTPPGAPLPLGLVLTVALDCVVDGFLGGIACGLSPKAGVVLGCATTLEMGVLGMAYAARVLRSSAAPWLRWGALVVPPLIMWLCAGLGAVLADVSSAVPAVFVAFVSFGIVALLSLAVGELLPEALEAQGDDPKWYINALIFLAIYIVFILDRILPI